MESLMFMMAAVMSKEKLVERLKESVDEFDKDPSEENWRKVVFNSMLICTKGTMKKDEDLGEAMDMAQKYDKTKRAKDLLDPDKN